MPNNTKFSPIGQTKMYSKLGSNAAYAYKPPIAASELYPHKPIEYTNSRTFDFNLPHSTYYPPGGDQHVIPGQTDWWIVYNANPANGLGYYQRIEDGTAEVGPYVWEAKFQAGTYGASHGIGNIFTSVYGLEIEEIYFSLRFKVDADFVWHSISNKFLWYIPDQLLTQSRETGGAWLRGANLVDGYWLSPGLEGPCTLVVYNNMAITEGVWHHVEQTVNRSTGVWKTWLDGTLTRHATGCTFDEPYFEEILLESYRGGGGETLSQDTSFYYDNMHFAYP